MKGELIHIITNYMYDQNVICQLFSHQRNDSGLSFISFNTLTTTWYNAVLVFCSQVATYIGVP